MDTSQPSKQVVPTNIITGFLGAGKTTAILNLLKNKPDDERWAVLVNEFGEVGIDGSLFAGQHQEKDGVFIGEVPGGCMCCTAGVSMVVALHELLPRAQPDRLLIEPTGLGHPMEVLQLLGSPTYPATLQVQKVLTVVDARLIKDSRYTENYLFQQHIQVADIVVGNKADLYVDGDRTDLVNYVDDNCNPSTQIIFAEYGDLDSTLLTGETQTQPELTQLDELNSTDLPNVQIPIPACGYIKIENQGEGFSSVGWRFDQLKRFSHDKLFEFLSGLEVDRMKAVFATDTGAFAYNLSNDALTETPLQNFSESRIEIITTSIDPLWESQLLDCIDDLSLN
ncbi:MAG: GTP-binding protein [Pseudomonadota bacterium]